MLDKLIIKFLITVFNNQENIYKKIMLHRLLDNNFKHNLHKYNKTINWDNHKILIRTIKHKKYKTVFNNYNKIENMKGIYQ